MAQRKNPKNTKRMKLISLLTFILVVLLVSCTNRQPNGSKPIEKELSDSANDQLVADTIIYDVIIHNLDPDDQWAQQRLQYLNQRKLIDSIFELVYQGKVTAFDFFENRPLKLNEIRKIETAEDYSRDKIGKIQFAERWYFDPTHHRFKKEVISMVLGYDRISSDGVLLHKPVFKIYLNP
jgi:hypothetical protein